MIEQRKNQRFNLRLPFEILSEKTHRPKGETMNVSSCGVLFMAPAAIEVGDSIEYVITLPKAAGARADVRLRCMGKIVRKDDALETAEPLSAFAATLERYEFVRGKA